LFDKAAELFRESIRLDPENAAEAYNYMGYMWVEHMCISRKAAR